MDSELYSLANTASAMVSNEPRFDSGPVGHDFTNDKRHWEHLKPGSDAERFAREQFYAPWQAHHDVAGPRRLDSDGLPVVQPKTVPLPPTGPHQTSAPSTSWTRPVPVYNIRPMPAVRLAKGAVTWDGPAGMSDQITITCL